MTGASIEATQARWTSSLQEIKARIRPLFTRQRVADSAGLFLDGLLGNELRKTGWMRAEAAGDPGPWRHQQADSVEKSGFYNRHTGFTFVTAGLAHHFQGVFDVLLSLQARVLGGI